MDRSESDVRAYYERDEERGRLEGPLGFVDFERTKEIVSRRLPPPPAVVADIGGGPGRYALWLAGHGYEVIHRDLVPLHVDHARRDASALGLRLDSAVADARALDLADASTECAFLLGPLYHLMDRRDRLMALREAARIVRPGGVVFAAAISRWAPRLHGILVDRLQDEFPEVLDLIGDVERSGRLPPLHDAAFTGYAHRPQQLRAEVRAAGLDPVDLVCVEGPLFALPDLEELLASEHGRRMVFDAARAVERVPELIGLGPHLLVTAEVAT